MMIVPAVMSLLDRRAWYLPNWLDRLIPNLDVEGEQLMQELNRTPATTTGDASAAELQPTT